MPAVALAETNSNSAPVSVEANDTTIRVNDQNIVIKQDAKRGSEVLGITLTKMNESKDFHLAGFPHQALDTYLPKLALRQHHLPKQVQDSYRLRNCCFRQQFN